MPSSSFLYEQPEALLIHVADPELPLHIADYHLSRDEVTLIGRQADVHLLINESSVSRHHAQISYTNGLYLLRDLNSMNGTYVNDIRIDPNQPHMLRAEDLVRIGLKTEFKFVVRLHTTPEAPAPQPSTRAIYSSPAEERAPTVALSTERTLQRPPAAAAEKRLPPEQAAQLAPPSVPALIILPETVLEEMDGSPRIYLLTPNKRVSIGRALGNDVEIIDPNVSRRHAEIFADHTGYFIRDLNSSHGVQVNQHRIDQPYRLSHGDRIVLGGSMLFFVDLQSGKEQTSQMLPIEPPTINRPTPEPAAAYPQRRTTTYLQEPPEVRSSARRPAAANTNKIPVQVVICSRCGVANMPVARFCASCSAPLSLNDAR
jgi:pSer/pThr/pTyr-binding forkhead associated (FHA) protein